MKPVLCDTVDHVPLAAADIVASLLECRLDIRLELAERLLVTTDEVTVDGVVGHIERKAFDIGYIDERGVYLLEVAREETPLLEPLVGGETVGELDGDIEVGRT